MYTANHNEHSTSATSATSASGLHVFVGVLCDSLLTEKNRLKTPTTTATAKPGEGGKRKNSVTSHNRNKKQNKKRASEISVIFFLS